LLEESKKLRNEKRTGKKEGKIAKEREREEKMGGEGGGGGGGGGVVGVVWGMK